MIDPITNINGERMIDNIVNVDCFEGMRMLEAESVDLIITSPPYDTLRDYNDPEAWTFDKFKVIAREMRNVLKPGGVIVWVVNDATIKGSRTGSSARQQLYFQDECGLNLHDHMIYKKPGAAYPAHGKSVRYSQVWENMFVFSKGKPKHINLISDHPNRRAGEKKWGRTTARQKDGDVKDQGIRKQMVTPEFSPRQNVWEMRNMYGHMHSDNRAHKHPATFPEELAAGHIRSWSDVGDIVLDPFCGSGTTCRVALWLARRYIGFEKNPEYAQLARELCVPKAKTLFNAE